MSNFIDIYIDEREKSFSIECPLCFDILQTLEDSVSVYNHDCCSECFTKFVEPNKNYFGKDWQPSQEEIDNWLSKKKTKFKPRYRFF